MFKKLGAAVLICCVIALSGVLAGCGGTIDKSGFVGEWSLVYGSEEDFDATSIKLMKSLGYETTLTLGEDGKGSLDLFGDADDVTWEASSNTKGTLKVDEADEYSIEIANEQLTIAKDSGESMTFEK